LRSNRCSQQLVMPPERGMHCFAMMLPALRAAFDIGEQKCNRTARWSDNMRFRPDVTQR
jgi:hypothetical protein